MRIRWVNVYEEATLKLICRHHIPFLPRSRMFDAQSFGENDKTRADQTTKKTEKLKNNLVRLYFCGWLRVCLHDARGGREKEGLKKN